MPRDYDTRREAGHLAQDGGVLGAEEADAGVRYTSSGPIPPVGKDFADAGVSASDRAFTPGIAYLRGVYGTKEAPKRPKVMDVANEVLKHTLERTAMLDWIADNVGWDERSAVAEAVEELERAAIAKREAKKPHIEGGGLVTHELAPTLMPPAPAMETNDPRKTHQEREEFERQRDADRQLKNPEAGHHEGEDKKAPALEELERRQQGAPAKTDEEKANEEKLTDPSHRRDVTPPGIRKKHER